MRYGNPGIAAAMDKLRAPGCDRILVGAAVSAVFGERDRRGARRGLRARAARAPDAGPADDRLLPRRSRLHQGARAQRQRLLDEARPSGQARDELPRPAAARRSTWATPTIATARRPARLLATELGARAEQLRGDVPVALRRAEWLKPYTAGHARPAGQGGRRRASTSSVPGFVCRLPRDARGDRHRGQAGVSRRGRPRVPRDPLPQRASAVDRRAGRLVVANLQGWLAPPPDAAARESTLMRAKTLGARQ